MKFCNRKQNKILQRLKEDEKFLSSILDKFEKNDIESIEEKDYLILSQKFLGDTTDIQTYHVRHALYGVADKIRNIENQNIQHTANRTQKIIAGAMVITAIITVFSAYFSYSTYSLSRDIYTLELRPFIPKLYLNGYCSEWDQNNIIKFETTITNAGIDAVLIDRNISVSENIDVWDLEIEGIIVNYGRGKRIELGRNIILGGKDMPLSYEINTSELTVDSFNLSFSYSCIGIESECNIVGGVNSLSCEYVKIGDKYQRRNGYLKLI